MPSTRFLNYYSLVVFSMKWNKNINNSIIAKNKTTESADSSVVILWNKVRPSSRLRNWKGKFLGLVWDGHQSDHVRWTCMWVCVYEELPCRINKIWGPYIVISNRGRRNKRPPRLGRRYLHRIRFNRCVYHGTFAKTILVAHWKTAKDRLFLFVILLSATWQVRSILFSIL